MKKQSPVVPRKVSISYNPISGRLVVRPKIVSLCAGAREEILWRCRNASLDIRFEPETTPFRAWRWRCAKGGGCLSGIPKTRRTPTHRIRYTVTVLDSAADGNGHSKGRSTAKKSASKNSPQAAKPCAPAVREAFLVLE